MTKTSVIITVLFIAGSLAGIGWLVSTFISQKDELPVLGMPGHIAGPFAFVDQRGDTVTQADIRNKVTVAEYFFTTCPGICPVMNANLKKVYDRFAGNPDFAILSHTVDPQNDSVAVMAAYAAKMGVQAPSWEFLTGDKYDLYRVAADDYLLSVTEADVASIDNAFIHTEKVALLDQQRRIRGFYDATNPASVDQLIHDIERLLH